MSITDIAPAVAEFFRAKPWEKIKSGALLFGLEIPEKGISYAVLTGRENGYSLALCRSAQALFAYAALLNAKMNKADEMQLISLMLDQDYLECRQDAADDRLLNKWLRVFGVEKCEWPKELPVLRRHEPAHLPRMIREEEAAELAAALHAAIYLAQREDVHSMDTSDLGQMSGEGRIPCVKLTSSDDFSWQMMEMPKNVEVEFPSLCLRDELAARRLRRIPVSGAEVRCAIRMLPIPADEKAERVPAIMLLLDDQQGLISSPVVMDYGRQYSELASEYIGYVEEYGRPRRILAADPRAFCLLKDLAGQMSTPIQRAGQIPEIDAAMNSFLEYMKSSLKNQKKTETKKEKPSRKAGRGICLYCEKEFSGSGMTKHIRQCGAEHRQPGAAEYFMIRVVDSDDPNFWLYVEIKKDASLKQLDQFLRDIWVECCGHMSAFSIDGEEYYSDASGGGRGMSGRLFKLLENGQRFGYEYDFGTPTNLELQIVDEYTAKDRRRKAEVKARNIMPQYKCVKCGKRAEMVFRPGMEPVEESVFCEECAAEEADAECMLPLLNSPRTGVCGYGAWLSGDDDFEE